MNVITAGNLKTPMPSNEWVNKLRASVQAFAKQHDPLTAGLWADTWAGPHAVHGIYSFGLKTIIERGINSDKPPICLRYVAATAHEDKVASACLASPEVPGMPAKVVAAMRGPEMAELLADANLLNQLSELENPDNEYEFRVLRVPAIYLEAFWLRSVTSGRADLIVPYGLLVDGDSIKLSGGTTLTRKKAYPADEFLERVRAAARHCLANAKSSRPGYVFSNA